MIVLLCRHLRMNILNLKQTLMYGLDQDIPTLKENNRDVAQQWDVYYVYRTCTSKTVIKTLQQLLWWLIWPPVWVLDLVCSALGDIG